ncbi:MAG: hypothetical protein ACYC24_08770 [Desulfobacteria bacterium]
MNAHTIGTYQVPGGESYTLTVPDDPVSRKKIVAVIDRMETAAAAEDELQHTALVGVLLSVLLGCRPAEVATMIPVETIGTMLEDIARWTDGLRPLPKC